MDIPISKDQAKISTYIFLDLETTGLLAEQKRKCRITELSMIAVDRINMHAVGFLPRVVNKVTICVNPVKPISAMSSNMTGLFNDSLECQKPFSAETVQLINAFINLHQKPVCLLSHNGNRFDFPLLISELKRINQSFCDDILCADTLEMFRSMDGLPRSHEFDTKVKTPSSTNSPCPSTSRDQRELTPTKPIQTPQNQLSPQKRKFTVNADDSNANISPKIIKQEAVTSSVNQSNNVAMVTPRDKVKAALKFNNITVKEETSNKGTQDTEGNAGVKRETDDARTTCNEDEAVPNTAVKTVTNTIAKGKTDSIPEFAASLEDSNYLQALDDVENDIEKDKEKLGTMEKTNESIDVGKSIHFIGTSTNFPCYVSTTTGYYVKTANNSKNDTGSKKDGTNDKASSESKIDTPIDLTVSNNRNDVVAVTDESVVVNSKGKEFGKGSEELIANTNTVNDETKGDSDSVMKVENDGRIINVTNAQVENNEDHNESVTERKTDESKWISNSRYNSSSVTGRETHRPTTGTSIRASTNVFIKSINKTMLSSPLYITKPVSTTGMSSSTTHSVNSSTKPVSSNSGSFIRPQSNSISSSSFSKPLTMNSGSSATLPSNSTPNAAGSLTKPPSSNYGSPARHQSNSTLYATPLKRISNSNSGSFTPSKSVSPAGSAIPFPKPSPTSTYSPSKMSYKLDSIHARKFGALPAVSHSAEADCVTLLKVVKRTAESLEWLDDNAVLFSTVPLPF